MGKLPLEENNLCFDKTISNWDEAIPIGNGLCGALIWGSSDALRFSLDRGDIWDTTPFEGVSSPEFTYGNMVRFAKKGDINEIRRVFDAPYNHPLPSKLPAGKLIFDFKRVKNVCSHLDLSCAQATITIDEIVLKSYMSATKKCGMISVNLPLSEFDFKIENPEYAVKSEQENGVTVMCNANSTSLKKLAYPAPIVENSGTYSCFVQNINKNFSYGVFVKAKEICGQTELCFYVATSLDGVSWRQDADLLLDDMLRAGYDAEFSRHKAWWHEYWGESSVSLPDSLFEKNWYLSHYFLAACSKKGCYPMPLQGVWTADNGALPPWKGDYHHDLNTQMSYYSYLKANHISQGESFIDYLWSMKDCAQNFAKSFYNSDGICMPSTTSLDGAPLGGWGMYSLSPTNQLWLCQAFERHYRFTGDDVFLREKAYIYLAETAKFILCLLKEKDGLLFLPISSSPEIHDDEIGSFVTPNSNYDLSMMRYLFATLADFSCKLNNGDEAKWQATLSKLPPLAMDENGVLKISPDESLEQSHRHFSHAMAIHPLRLITYQDEKDKRIVDATILDLERLGTGFWVGFSFTWMAELYTVQKNGEGAAFQLEIFWRNHCSQNGFHLNGDFQNRGTSTFHYRPFTLEANMCAADALAEMLLQSENSTLELFPAVPAGWKRKELSFESLRAEHGLLVSASMENFRVTSLTLQPQYTEEIVMKNPEIFEHLHCKTPVNIVISSKGATLSLEAYKKYSFTYS